MARIEAQFRRNHGRFIVGAVVFGSLLFVITFADTHSHTYYIRRRGIGGEQKRRQGVAYVECVQVYAPPRQRSAMPDTWSVLPGECVRFKWRTSHTKGAIVEIRIRPKHITYDRLEPEAQ